MRSPIAKTFRVLSHLTEWGHRYFHGPRFEVGDTVEYRSSAGRTTGTIIEKRPGNKWVLENGVWLDGSAIIRVVKYG